MPKSRNPLASAAYLVSNKAGYQVSRLRVAYGTAAKSTRGNGRESAMPRRQERVITKRVVDALSVEGKDAVFWDRDLPGAGIRVYPSGRKVYVVQSRGPGGSKRVTVGEHGDHTPVGARPPHRSPSLR